MNTKYVDKYNEIETEFFSTAKQAHWTFEWGNEKNGGCIDYDFKKKKYIYWKRGKIFGEYKDIYEAIDNIKIGKRTIRQALLETDFDFTQIV